MWKLKNFFCFLLLAVSAYAATLTCQFDPQGACPSFTLSPVTQVNEVISVFNPPFTPYKDNTTTSINLDSTSVITQFPTKLFDIFINVNYFSASNISTTELATDSFYSCNRLNYIQFNYCNLGNIRAGFASSCHFVSSFYAMYSQITSIDENAFQGMLSLQMVYLGYNDLTCIPPLLFQPLKGLMSIDLSYNKITALHSQLFADLPTLSMVNAMNNLITYIPNFNLNHTGMSYSSSFSLSLGDNPIQAIHPLFMTSLYYGRSGYNAGYSTYIYFYPSQPNVTTCATNVTSYWGGDLHYIGGSSNWIQQNTSYQYSTTCYTAFTSAMGDDSLVTCGSVLATTTATPTTLNPNGGNGTGSSSGGQCATDKVCRYYLDWSNTYTCVIDGAEGTVTSITGAHYLTYVDTDVTRLYFTNSYLNLVPSILFTKFPNLKYLHIANSGMSVINDQTFNQCGNLELLDASNNQISFVEETALRNCTKLRVIDLTGNPIDFVSGGLYELDPSLERIHLNRNPDWILA